MDHTETHSAGRDFPLIVLFVLAALMALGLAGLNKAF
jgi:hypothetical protein